MVKLSACFCLLVLALITFNCDDGVSGNGSNGDNKIIIPSFRFCNVGTGDILVDTFFINTMGIDSTNWNASTDVSWIKLSDDSNVDSNGVNKVFITIDIEGIDPGDHYGKIIVVEGDSSETEEIDVRLTIVDEIAGHELTEDETWSGDLLIKGDIKVPAGKTLKILPGSELKIKIAKPDWDGGLEDNLIDIYSRGKIIAEGTASKPIHITVDHSEPQMSMWWGIGVKSSDAVIFKYFSVSYAENGLFIFGSAEEGNTFQNCLFSHNESGITNMGGSNTMSRTTFSNCKYAYARWESWSVTDITNSEFKDNTSIDVWAVDAYTTVNVSKTNFSSPDAENLEIFSSDNVVGVTITADNCYGIENIDDHGNGTITETDKASSEISGAGCGFSLPRINTGRGKLNSSMSTDEKIEKIKYYYEKEANMVW